MDSICGYIILYYSPMKDTYRGKWYYVKIFHCMLHVWGAYPGSSFSWGCDLPSDQLQHHIDDIYLCGLHRETTRRSSTVTWNTSLSMWRPSVIISGACIHSPDSLLWAVSRCACKGRSCLHHCFYCSCHHLLDRILPHHSRTCSVHHESCCNHTAAVLNTWPISNNVILN